MVMRLAKNGFAQRRKEAGRRNGVASAAGFAFHLERGILRRLRRMASIFAPSIPFAPSREPFSSLSIGGTL
jgi:hypothetical protein